MSNKTTIHSIATCVDDHKKTTAWSLGWSMVPPMIATCVFLAMFRQHDWDILNHLELPILNQLIYPIVGQYEILDRILIFFNIKLGEAVTAIATYVIFFVLLDHYEQRIPLKDRWSMILLFSGFVFIAWFLSHMVGGVIENTLIRQSPSYLPDCDYRDLANIYGVKVKTQSPSCFPSSHGIVFFSVYFMTMYRYGFNRAIILIPMVILFSSPRVFAGSHWLSDSLVGSGLVTWCIAAVMMRSPIYAKLYIPIENHILRSQ